MKVLQDSRHQLRLKNSPGILISFFMLMWGSGFIGMPIWVMASLVKDLGVTTVRCDRPEPSLVSCEKQRRTFFGLVQEPSQTYSALESAEHLTKTGVDDDGDPTYTHWVTVSDPQREEVFIEDTIMVNGVKGDAVEMAAIADQINDFIQSSEPQISFQSENRLKPGNFFMLGFISLFPFFGAIALYSILQTEELIFDRELGLLQRKRKTLLGPKQQDLPLHSITGVCIDTSRRDDTVHQLNLLPKTLHTQPLMESHNLSSATEIEGKIQQFLNAT